MALRRSARLDAEVEPFDIHQVMNDSLLITGHRLRTHEVELEMTSHAVLLGARVTYWSGLYEFIE